MNRLARFMGRWGASPPPDREPVVPLTFTSPESYAMIYNEGHEDAVAQGLVDPLTARDWLAGRLARERYNVLRKMAQSARERGDIGKPDGGVEAWDWLDAQADLEADAASDTALPAQRVDLTPFEAVLADLDARVRAFGGGTQDAYANAAALLRHALARYQQVDD